MGNTRVQGPPTEVYSICKEDHGHKAHNFFRSAAGCCKCYLPCRHPDLGRRIHTLPEKDPALQQKPK